MSAPRAYLSTIGGRPYPSHESESYVAAWALSEARRILDEAEPEGRLSAWHARATSSWRRNVNGEHPYAALAEALPPAMVEMERLEAEALAAFVAD